MDTYAYKDKQKEKARLAALTSPSTTTVSTTTTSKKKRKNTSEAWSDKTAQKLVREQRRAKRQKRREANLSPEEKARQAEWMELAEEVKARRAEKEGGKGVDEGFRDM